MQGFDFNNSVVINTSLFQAARSLGIFSVEEFNNWKNDKKTEEQGKTQTLDTTKHTDTSSYHGNHSNSGGYHSDSHSDGQVQTGHGNAGNPAGDHTDTHIDVNTEPHNQSSGGGAHTDVAGGHADTHVDNTTGHIDVPEYSHSDTGHSNYIPHSNGGHNNTTHNNVGFDHDNYIPSKPHLFEVDELADPKLIRDTTRIGLYSYDKNSDGHGTQDSQSKTVKFYMRIRKIKDIDGASDISSWENLIANSIDDTYDLDTIDPLGTGNTDKKLTEGFYQIEAWAVNDPKSQRGVSKTYESEHKLVTVKVQQNIEPEITVTNEMEIINFVFGPLGAADKDTGNYTPYEDNLYTEAPEDKKEGIFVTVNMMDKDINQWQRGNIYLADESNNKQAGTQVSIIWENGSEIINSDNALKTGYAFISKDKYLGLGLENAKVIIEITDYKDSACTQKAGVTITQRTISKSDLRELTLSIDVTRPVVNPPTVNVTGHNSITVIPSASDLGSGLRSSPYLYNRNGVNMGSWTNKNLNDTGLTPNTLYSYKYNAVDLAGNEKWSSQIDKYTLALNPSLVKITGFNTSSITFNISHSSSNTIVPDTKIILKKKGTSIIKSESQWTKNTNILVTGLTVGEEYDTYIRVRNEDEIENPEIKLSASSSPPLQDINGDPIDNITADKLPTVSSTTDINNVHYSQNTGFNNIPLTGRVNDLDINDKTYVKYTIDGVLNHTNKQIFDAIPNGIEASFDYDIQVNNTIPEGTHIIRIWAEDSHGGKSAEIVKTIVVDKSAPVPSFSPNGNSTWQRQHTARAAISDISNITESKYIWTASNSAPSLDPNWKAFNTGDALALDSETGIWYLHIYTKDNLGNENTFTSNPYSIDNEAPLVVFEPQTIGWTVNELSIKVIAQDNKAGYKRMRYAWSKEETEPSTWSIWDVNNEIVKVKSDEGVWYFHVQAEDNLGNTVTTYKGPYKYFEITPVSGDSFKIEDTTVDTIKVSFDTAANQEYQLWLEDEAGTRIGTSEWIRLGEYTFKDIELKPNTKYIPNIITRRYDEEGMKGFTLAEIEISNKEAAYTNAEGIAKARFEPGTDFIEIELAVETLNNPNDTEYLIKNDITGQTSIVTHDNPVWKNTGLSKESFYDYSAKVIHVNGKPSYFTKLNFTNGEEAHTDIKDLDVDEGDLDDVKPGDIINLDDLSSWDTKNPVWFDLDDMMGKTVQIGGEYFYITRNKQEIIKNTNKIDAKYYAYSKEGFSYSPWKELIDGSLEEKLYFNQPGFYNTHFKFKNYIKESKPIKKGYFVDWMVPEIQVEKKIQGQTAVTDSSFDIRINASDNISQFLFYSTDKGESWYYLKNTLQDISFNEINKSVDGILNKFTLQVSDICGNKAEVNFDIWGIEN